MEIGRHLVYSGEPARGWLPWGALAPFLGLAFVIVPLFTITLWLQRVGLADANGDPLGKSGMFVFLLLPFATIAALVLGWVHFVERRPLSSIGLARTGAGGNFLRGHLIGCATILAVVLAAWLSGGFDAMAFGKALHSPRALLDIGTLLSCFLVQASVEEVLFRGWLLSAIARKFNVVLAVILSSLVFCLLHYSPHQPWLVTLNLALFALFACSWALKTNSIWGVMGWHAGWNWLLATGFELPVTGLDMGTPALLVQLVPRGPDYLTGGPQGPEGGVFCGLFFVIAILWIVRRKPSY